MNRLFRKARLREAKLAFLVTFGLGVSTILFSIAGTWIEQITTRSGFDKYSTPLLLAFILGLGLLVFVFFFLRLPGLTRRFGAVADILAQEELPSRPYLITGISAFSNGANGKPEQIDLSVWSPERLAEAIDADGGGRGIFGNWQQNLRILFACPGITHVYVLENNLIQFAQFQAVAKCFFPDLIIHRIEAHNTSGPDTPFSLSSRRSRNKNALRPDYEDFSYVTVGIERALEMICQEHGLRIHEAEANCFLDTTSGFKTLSIIAAISSVNRPIIIVYCSTAPRYDRDPGQTWEVIGYDISMEMREK